MCGIAGHFFFDHRDRSQEIQGSLKKMMLALRHRGPNAQGDVVYPVCGLGMTRLSVIDLHTGNQPIFDSSRRFSIVFNGEIYNYKLLRGQLEAEGVQFSTHSDTEVVLHGYLKLGEKFLDALLPAVTFASIH